MIVCNIDLTIEECDGRIQYGTVDIGCDGRKGHDEGGEEHFRLLRWTTKANGQQLADLMKPRDDKRR